ncbi:MAG: DNA repair protein RecO [Gammaproteobacteria bacterium]|nr:DNA repair protein RecO [Gammaproteobacteria bacterium]
MVNESRRVALQPAYVLHQRPFRNTSLLLELLTPGHGRVGLVARGVRTQRSRLRPLLQAFRPLLVSWSGRGELGTLTGVEGAERAPSLQGRALLAGFYLNELLVRLLGRHDPHADLFTAYHDALQALAGSWGEAALRIFEKRLLQALGYGLVLEHEVERGRALEPEALYCYRLEHGPVPAKAGEAGLTVHGATLLALARERLESARALREAKALTRAALGLYLGDRPLKSRDLFVPPAADAGR